MQKCKSDNQTLAEEQLALQKRKQAAQEMKETREKAAAATTETDDVLDSLLEKLRNGEGVGRKPRRTRGAAELQPVVPLALQLDGTTDDTADIARDMLAQLQSNGFVAPISPTAPTNPSTRRRTRRRMEASTEGLVEPKSPISPPTELELDLSTASEAES